MLGANKMKCILIEGCRWITEYGMRAAQHKSLMSSVIINIDENIDEERNFIEVSSRNLSTDIGVTTTG
jgi:hypothetical protein